MGGPGQGQGGKPSFGNAPDGSRPEVARGRLDPKGRMTVTNFRGLPKPGELTVQDLEVLRAARDDAQAPLESDQIPRRYREGIRSWFDTLPENK
ncbi:MAG: hypothetical protein K8T90_20865 [Planctomycetes bacterium]|nr:hypothetical protein [Planctomycetota bacterium]